jgi:hypothetical protein
MALHAQGYILVSGLHNIEYTSNKEVINMMLIGLWFEQY